MPVHKYSEPEPGSRYTLLRLVPSGRFLALGNDGALAAVRCCGDDAMWTTTAEEGHFAHHSGALTLVGAPSVPAQDPSTLDPLFDLSARPVISLAADDPDEQQKGGAATVVAAAEGPAALPSASLASLHRDGYVVLPNLLGPRLLGRIRGEIERLRLERPFPDIAAQQTRQGVGGIAASHEFARMALQPVLQYLVGQYINKGLAGVRLAHAPAVGILQPRGPAAKDDASTQGGGWHVDYPVTPTTDRLTHSNSPVTCSVLRWSSRAPLSIATSPGRTFLSNPDIWRCCSCTTCRPRLEKVWCSASRRMSASTSSTLRTARPTLCWAPTPPDTPRRRNSTRRGIRTSRRTPPRRSIRSSAWLAPSSSVRASGSKCHGSHPRLTYFVSLPFLLALP